MASVTDPHGPEPVTVATPAAAPATTAASATTSAATTASAATAAASTATAAASTASGVRRRRRRDTGRRIGEGRYPNGAEAVDGDQGDCCCSRQDLVSSLSQEILHQFTTFPLPIVSRRKEGVLRRQAQPMTSQVGEGFVVGAERRRLVFGTNGLLMAQTARNDRPSDGTGQSRSSEELD
jgi:hypothetical protein